MNEDNDDTDYSVPDRVDADTRADLKALETPSGNFIDFVFVIPLAAPLPLELQDAVITDGPLLKRLEPLMHEKPESDLAIVPLSGTELLSLTRAWPLLQEAKRVAVLSDLPGAQYDVLFTQARAQVGLRLVPWPEIEESIKARVITNQRTKDKQPWRFEKPSGGPADGADDTDLEHPTQKPGRSRRGLKQAVANVPIPEDDYEDQP